MELGVCGRGWVGVRGVGLVYEGLGVCVRGAGWVWEGLGGCKKGWVGVREAGWV